MPSRAKIDLSRPLSEQPALLTMSEAAALLRRSARSLRRWNALGLLRIVRPCGGEPLVERAELERILREGRG